MRTSAKGSDPILTAPQPEPARFLRPLRALLALSLTLSAGLYFLWTIHWPLVGDASLIHYIAFLIERGWAPYRQLGDMNMPGSFLIELAAMHLFGAGDLGWRLFDFALLALASVSFFLITQRQGRLAGLFAAALFILIHGRDGLAEGGQRDLTMAVCLLAATACLLLAFRTGNLWINALFGLLSGLALTIKPTALPLTLAQLAIVVYLLHRRQRPWRSTVFCAASTALIAPAICLAFLLHERALRAFLAGLRTIVPYYASLGHRPISFLVLHSVSPLLPLVLLWLAILALARPAFDLTRALLLAGVAFGLINCIVQARGLPYYRYPLLAFLLPLIAIDLTTAIETHLAPTLRARATRILALAALCFGGLFLAPQSAILLHHYQYNRLDFIASLQQNLTALGGPALSGRIQCIDSISGCGNVLYRMRLEPATGVLSDFLLFGQPNEDPTTVPILRDTRDAFSAAILARPPQVIVVTSHLHIDGPDNFLKLARWPAFADLLATRYTLATEWHPTRTARWWSREETPASYRIYLLHP